MWAEQLAGRLLAMNPQTFRQERQAFFQEKSGLTTALANLAESVAAMRTLVSESQAAAAAHPENRQLVAEAGRQLENMQVNGAALCLSEGGMLGLADTCQQRSTVPQRLWRFLVGVLFAACANQQWTVPYSSTHREHHLDIPLRTCTQYVLRFCSMTPLVMLLQQVVARLVSNFERLRVVNVELARRAIIKDLVAGGRSEWWSKRMQKLRAGLVSQQQQQQQRDEWKQAFRMCPRDLQQQLEASFIADVSIAKPPADVFKTLRKGA